MKKLILRLSIVLSVFIAFTSCGSRTDYYPIADEPTSPHPFAMVLEEYIEDYDGVVHAYLVTLDDDGAMGVLTTRPATRILVDYDSGQYGYEPSGTLFYMQDGDLFKIDVSGYWLFAAGRYNRLMQRIYAHTHVVELIYKLEFGSLEISTRLEYFSDEYLSTLFDEHDVVAELISKRDALAEYAREKYGLVALLPPNLGHMRNTENQTEQILSMTINCVPSLATTSERDYFIVTFHSELPTLTFELITYREIQSFIYIYHTVKITVRDATSGQIIQEIIPSDYTFFGDDVAFFDDSLGFVIEDMNFDGYADISIVEFLPASPNIPRLYWVWDREEERYAFCSVLSGLTSLEVDNENKALISHVRWNARQNSTAYYKFVDNNLVAFRIILRGFSDKWREVPDEITYEAIMGITHSRGWGYYIITFEYIDGKWKETEVSPIPYAEE